MLPGQNLKWDSPISCGLHPSPSLHPQQANNDSYQYNEKEKEWNCYPNSHWRWIDSQWRKICYSGWKKKWAGDYCSHWWAEGRYTCRHCKTKNTCIVLCENITCMSVSSDIQSVLHLAQISQELCTHAVSCLTWNWGWNIYCDSSIYTAMRKGVQSLSWMATVDDSKVRSFKESE